jgi:hypothetical protein
MTFFKTILAFLLCVLTITTSKGQSKECLEQFSWYDTTTINGNYIVYHVKNDSATIEYGNKSFHRLFPYKIECQIADSRIPHFEWDTHDFVVLRYGCGSPCWGIFILPLDSVSAVRHLMYEMAFDAENNLVAYLDCDTYTSLIIENLKTKQSRRIEFPFKTDHGEFIGFWIEDISVKDNMLYIKYYNPNKDFSKSTSSEVKINIDLK